MEGSYTFTEALSEVVSGIPIEIRPTIKANGTGNIALVFAAPTGELYDRVDAEPVSEEQKALWNVAFPFDENGINRNGISTTGISGTGIKSGVYSVTIRFYKSNVLVYATMQEISVYDNMTTSVWDGGGANSPINNGTFTVTQALINSFKLTNLFVASTTSTPAGNDNNSGTPYSPIASINEALRRISVTGSANENYTIWLMSDITENVSMKGTAESGENIALNGKASSITIQPMGNSVTLNGTGENGSVFNNSTSVPVTLENLTIRGGVSEGFGAGIYIYNNSEVTLSNCTVTGNKVTKAGSNGGGVYNLGTLNVKGKVNITGNTKEVSGADAQADNVYLPSGKTINIIDALDQESKIGVTTVNKPSYGSQVVITNGLGDIELTDAQIISNIFSGDEGYAVLAGTDTNAGEAVLEASGGSMSDVFDYSVALSCEDEEVVPGSIVTVTAAVTNGDTPVTPAAEDITWNFELLCYGDHVATLQGASLVGYGSVQIPSNLVIFDGVPYTLHATAVFNGVGYDKDFTLVGNSDTLSAQGFVAVAGATVTGAVSNSKVFVEGGTKVIPNMYVCDHEVTQAEFAAVMEKNTSFNDGSSGQEPSENEKQKNRPVEQVSWYTALVYCNKRSIAEGLTPCYMINNSTNPDSWGEVPDSATHTNYAAWNAVTCDFNANGYRLPTIAEWEYAARGGNGLTGDQCTYSGSDSASAVAWYGVTSENGGKTHEVKKKDPNALGIYDMSGNVWEWCWDSNGGNQRYARGGNYWREDDYGKLDYMGMACNPFEHGAGDGFRVVRTLLD